MPTFASTGPVSATVVLDAGSLRVETHGRPEIAVEIHPASPAHEADVRTAALTRVDCADGRLTVQVPRHRSLFGPSGAVDVLLKLPVGAHLDTRAALADVQVAGRLGGCRIQVACGDIRIADAATGSVVAETAYGDVEVGVREGSDARIDAGTGFGNVRNLVDVAARPQKAADRVQVRAHTQFGDVVIRRTRAVPA